MYLHIPFCQSKCGYCDFYSITDTSFVSPFLKALKTEIKFTAEGMSPLTKFDSIYIGGGTPSLLAEKDVEQILDILARYYDIEDDCEITIEVNPGTIDRQKLLFLRKLGINRISIGVQSFFEHELKMLERIHSAEQARKASIESRENGFENISIDLIFAIPGQNLKNWQFSLQTAMDFQPEHLSVYNLTYESGTAFFERLQAGAIHPLSDREESRLFAYAKSFLNQNGYHHYEISNYSLSHNTVSRHNYKYWMHVNYLGFGPAAHSFWNNKRWANVNVVSSYIRDLSRNILPVVSSENLAADTLKFEYIFLSLRTSRGLCMEEYEKKFDVRFDNEYSLLTADLINKDLARVTDGYFQLTNKGM